MPSGFTSIPPITLVSIPFTSRNSIAFSITVTKSASIVQAQGRASKSLSNHSLTCSSVASHRSHTLSAFTKGQRHGGLCFGSLPPELRNTVYSLTLPEPGHITVDIRPQAPLTRGQKVYWALATTCKSIWQESMSLFLAQNSVDVIITPLYLAANDFACSPPLLRLRRVKRGSKSSETAPPGVPFASTSSSEANSAFSELRSQCSRRHRALAKQELGGVRLVFGMQYSSQADRWRLSEVFERRFPRSKLRSRWTRRSISIVTVSAEKDQACVCQFEESELPASVPGVGRQEDTSSRLDGRGCRTSHRVVLIEGVG